jgi:3-hydroxyisobutyrate dehydrogenase-like beta-hydroxyacid dehydrogenase
MKQTVGLIGLGLMGQGLAHRLAEIGCSTVGYDIDAARLAQAARPGFTAVASPAEVAKRAEVVLVCVVNTAAVEAVV